MISKMKKKMYVALEFMFIFYCFEKYCQIMTSESTELGAKNPVKHAFILLCRIISLGSKMMKFLSADLINFLRYVVFLCLVSSKFFTNDALV